MKPCCKSSLQVVAQLLAGAVCGCFLIAVCDAALLEVTISIIFSVVFAIVLLVLGALIAYRVWDIHRSEPLSLPVRVVSIVFLLLLVLAAILCFLVDNNLLKSLPTGVRVLFYMLLGSVLSFVICYSMMEMFVMCQGKCRVSSESSAAMRFKDMGLIAVGSLLLGLAQGLIYGLVESRDQSQPLATWLSDLAISVPVGASFGVLMVLIMMIVRCRAARAASSLFGGGSGSGSGSGGLADADSLVADDETYLTWNRGGSDDL